METVASFPLLAAQEGQDTFRAFQEELEEDLARLGASVQWEPPWRDDRALALALEHVRQVHVDVPAGPVRAALGGGGPAQTAARLVSRLARPGRVVLVDWSETRMEGRLGGRAPVGRPWWVERLYGLDLEDVAWRDLGSGVCVAVLDHPVDRDHPCLAGRLAPPVEAWRLPWTRPTDVVADDHGTGSAGLVAGLEPQAGVPLGAAPAATILPVHLWPGGHVRMRADRIRILSRAFDGLRRRQLTDDDTPPLQVVTQQVALTSLSFPGPLAFQQDAAWRVLRALYARVSGLWGLAVLASAGSHPRAEWAVLPTGLPGVWGVGAVDEAGRLVRRSASRGLTFVAQVSREGRGPTSAGAGGGYLAQGQATSAAAPLVAGAVAALLSLRPMDPIRAVQLLRKRSPTGPEGASFAVLRAWLAG